MIVWERAIKPGAGSSGQNKLRRPSSIEKGSRGSGQDRLLADCPRLCAFRVLHRGLRARAYGGRGLKKVEAVVPHADPCSSFVKSGWRNIMGSKDTFKSPCLRDNDAWDWTVLGHSAEEFGSFLVSEKVVRALPRLFAGRFRFMDQGHGASPLNCVR